MEIRSTASFLVRATNTRFAFFFSSAEKENMGSNQFLNWLLQVSTGHLHIVGFEPRAYSANKKERLLPLFFIWCGQQDSNLHALAVEPKSTESTNSTMPAYSVVPLTFTRRGIRGGALRRIHAAYFNMQQPACQSKAGQLFSRLNCTK